MKFYLEWFRIKIPWFVANLYPSLHLNFKYDLLEWQFSEESSTCWHCISTNIKFLLAKRSLFSTYLIGQLDTILPFLTFEEIM